MAMCRRRRRDDRSRCQAGHAGRRLSPVVRFAIIMLMQVQGRPAPER